MQSIMTKHVAYEYLVFAMISREITFLVSSEALLNAFDGWSGRLSDGEDYRKSKIPRVQKAPGNDVRSDNEISGLSPSTCCAITQVVAHSDRD